MKPRSQIGRRWELDRLFGLGTSAGASPSRDAYGMGWLAKRDDALGFCRAARVISCKPPSAARQSAVANVAVPAHAKLRRPRFPARCSTRSGYMLVECLVYISVLMILLGLGFAAFYSCWDKSKSLRYHADDITRALRVGEHWRADIRSATGRIVVHTADDGQMVEIPRGRDAVVYVFTAGQLSRKLASADQWTVVLPKVATSEMQADPRTRVTAWRWDVELVPTRAQVRIPPRFTFEAVPHTVP